VDAKVETERMEEFEESGGGEQITMAEFGIGN
jgi:hypothetical protein